MRARLVVFPIEGRKWCFTRSFDRITADSQPSSSPPPPTLKGLWNKLTYEGRSMQGNAELAVDFISDKMNLGWINLEKAPAGTFKNKIHGLGVKLLSRVKPSEIFLKSVSKDIMKVDIIYPASLNPRLVRRRLRHIAMRGCINHKRYFYGSVTLLPFTMAFTVLPLPNVPFFWILFRAYSHWRALKGSERLLLLVSDCSKAWDSLIASENKSKTANDDSGHTQDHALQSPWVLQPSQKLERLLAVKGSDDGANSSRVSSICEAYYLSKTDVLKFKDSQ